MITRAMKETGRREVYDNEGNEGHARNSLRKALCGYRVSFTCYTVSGRSALFLSVSLDPSLLQVKCEVIEKT